MPTYWGVWGGGAPPGQNKRIIICYHMFRAWKNNLIPGTVRHIVVWQVCILSPQQPVAPPFFNPFGRLPRLGDGKAWQSHFSGMLSGVTSTLVIQTGGKRFAQMVRLDASHGQTHASHGSSPQPSRIGPSPSLATTRAS